MIKKIPIKDFTDITLTKEDYKIEGFYGRLDRVNELIDNSESVYQNFEELAEIEDNNSRIFMLDVLTDYLLDDKNFKKDDVSKELYRKLEFDVYTHLDKRAEETLIQREELTDFTVEKDKFDTLSDITYKVYYNKYGDTSLSTYNKRLNKMEEGPLEGFPEMVRQYFEAIQQIKANAKNNKRKLTYRERCSIGDCRKIICEMLYQHPYKSKADRRVSEQMNYDRDFDLERLFIFDDFIADADKLYAFLINVEEDSAYNTEDGDFVQSIKDTVRDRLEDLRVAIDNANRNLSSRAKITFVENYVPVIEYLLQGGYLNDYMPVSRKRLDIQRGLKRVCRELANRTHLYV